MKLEDLKVQKLFIGFINDIGIKLNNYIGTTARTSKLQ